MNCDVVMQMLCANCHLILGLGFLLGHFFGWQCRGLQGVSLLVMLRNAWWGQSCLLHG